MMHKGTPGKARIGKRVTNATPKHDTIPPCPPRLQASGPLEPRGEAQRPRTGRQPR